MPADVIKRRRSYPHCGRLIVLQALNSKSVLDQINSAENFSGFTAINFPAMPESIELARKADYMVTTPIGFPDGIHMYKGTSVLEIPISFKLHSFDKEYCPHGVKTLLQVAASLESLTLPFGDSNVATASGPVTEKGQKPQLTEGGLVQNSSVASTTTYNVVQNIYPPATCYLELIVTERDSVGIACVGYVKDVKVKLVGPFMRGPGVSQNLPTHGEFEFTFVHHPGHGNNWNANVGKTWTEQQAYAQVVQTNLYNTVKLLTNPSNFHSFKD